MSKRALMVEFNGTRGSHAMPQIRRLFESLTDSEAAEMGRLLHNLKEDSGLEGARAGAKAPWKHGGFGV